MAYVQCASTTPPGCKQITEMEKRVRLEVHVPSLREGESVRVSGNIAELGEWNVHRSKPLSKKDG